MKPSTLGALIGAFAGFMTVVLLNIVVISAPVLRAILFPGNAFIHYATNKGFGDFGLMVFNSLAYFSNILLYAALGFGIGSLLETKRQTSASREDVHE